MDQQEDVRTLMEKHSIQTQPIWFLNHKQKPYKNAFAYNIDKATKLHIVHYVYRQ